MTVLSDVQIGSIVYSWISNIPTNISGILTTIVDQQVYFAEVKTGTSISTLAIENQYQPAIINLTIAGVLRSMESQGLGTASLSIGDLSVTKGLVNGTSKEWKELGIECLDDIGGVISYYQCWG